VNGMLASDGVRIRRATAADAEFLASLAVNEDVAPFIAVLTARDAPAFVAEVERAERAPSDFGRFVIEVEDERGASQAGSVAFEVANRRSRIANLYGLMLLPDFRGRGLARAATRLFARYLLRDLDYHRVQLECYGYNERAIRHFERAGFVREGVRRRAYRRDGEWVDGILFGLVREDMEEGRTLVTEERS
jgi:RimJ/RimL family protein N-acetyltransferase